jgi:hypothetical protein
LKIKRLVLITNGPFTWPKELIVEQSSGFSSEGDAAVKLAEVEAKVKSMGLESGQESDDGLIGGDESGKEVAESEAETTELINFKYFSG